MSAPPISGDNPPLKELKPDFDPKAVKKHGFAFYLLIVILLLIFFSIGIFLGFGLKKNNGLKEEIIPEPTAEPSAVEVLPLPTPLPAGLEGKIQGLKQKLEQVDLKEEQLNFPQLDFKIRFEVHSGS